MPRLSRGRHRSSPCVSLARSGTHNRLCSDPYGLVKLLEQTHWFQDVGLTFWSSKVSRAMERTSGHLTFAKVRKWPGRAKAGSKLGAVNKSSKTGQRRKF